GDHEIVVTAPGRRAHREIVTMREGEVKQIVLSAGEPEVSSTPAPLPASPPSAAAVSASVAPSPPLPSSSGATAGSPLGASLVGAGAVSLLGGIVAGAFALHSRSVVSSHCNGGVCDDTGLEAVGQYKSLSTVSTLSVVFGAVAIGGGG